MISNKMGNIIFTNKGNSVVLFKRKSIFSISIFQFTLKMANFKGKHTFASIVKK